MENARQARSQAKGVITRHLRTLERLVVEEKVDLVRDRLVSLESAFARLEEQHDAYVGLLTEDDDLDAVDNWFEDVHTSYVRGVKAAKVWLK